MDEVLSEEEARNVCRHLMAFGLEGLACKVATLRATLATVEAERDGLRKELAEIERDNAVLKMQRHALVTSLSEAGREQMDSLGADAIQKAARWDWVERNAKRLTEWTGQGHMDIWRFATVHKHELASFAEEVDQQLQEPTT